MTSDKPHPTVDGRCGTYNGYATHRRRKEQACDPCLEAKCAYALEQRLRNPERTRLQNKKWKKSNSDQVKSSAVEYYRVNQERIKQMSATWRSQNSERVKAHGKEWREANRERKKTTNKKWRQANPEKELATRRRRRARKLNRPSEHYTVHEILNIYGSDCHICGNTIDLNAPRGSGRKIGWELGLHLDHVIPLAVGGTDLKSNVRPAHAVCNIKKGKRAA